VTRAVPQDHRDLNWSDAKRSDAEEKLRAAFALSSIGMAMSEAATGRFVSVNHGLCAMTGYSEAELMERTFADITHPGDRALNLDGYGRLLRGEIHEYRVEKRYLRKDGAVIWVDVTASVVPGADSRPLRTLAIIQDITDRKQAEQALRESERRLRRIIDGMFAYVALYSPDGVMLETNQYQADQWGLRREDMVGQRPWEAARWADNPAAAEALRAAYGRAAKGEKIRGDVTTQLAPGRVVITDATLQPLVGEGGTVEGILSFGVDITERKLAEQQTVAALHEKETLLKEVHHRVKNNLAIVVELLSLQANQTDDPAARHALGESVDRIYAMALVHEMIYESSQLSAVDLGEYLERLSRKLLETYQAPGSNVDLRTQIAEVALTLDQAVPCSLILNELVTNALKHAFPQGRVGCIEITVGAGSDGHVVLEVRDNGVGMRADMDLHTSRSLGLRLVSSLARQLHATVEIAREEGTAVRIRFRAQPAGTAAALTPG
jgi:PAS domain S-box-containing protein